MDQLTSMAVFVACVETGSLSAGARASGISAAMATKHVRALERTLGVRLLDLTTRSLGLTDAGGRYLARCRQILGEVEEAALDAAKDQAEPRGLLRIAAPASFGRLHLAPAIVEYMARHPDVAVEAEFADRFVDLVQEGFDVAVRIGRLPDSSFVIRRLAQCRLLACAAPAYLERRGVPACPAELRDHDCLCLGTVTTPGLWQFIGRNGVEIAVRVGGRLLGNSMELLCEAAQGGLGIVYGPDFMLEPMVRAGRLRTILPDYPGRVLDVVALFPSSRNLSAKVRVFVDLLAQRFGSAKEAS